MGFDVTVKGFGSFTATVNGEQAVLAAEVHDASALLATMAAQGAKGDKGDTGATGGVGPVGPKGDKGDTGAAGAAATIAVGTTSTLAPGSSATVANSGTSSAAVFNFGIPQGEKGDKGDKGDTGNTGATGPQGPSGVVSATAPLAYDSGTKNLSIDLSAYATQSYVTSQGYITSSALTGYATETYVNSQGFITSSALSPYLLSSTAASTYQTQAGMSSYLTTSAAASTYAPLASPTFTGDPKAPTPATSDNDTSIATTAFVNAYCPAASTSTAGKVQLATVAEAITGTNTTKAINPDDLMQVRLTPNLNSRYSGSFVFAVTGSGGAQSTDWGQRCFTGTTNPSTALARSGASATYPVSRGKAAGVINFSKAVYITGTLDATQYVANSTIRLTLGKISTDGIGDLTRRGIGLRIVGTGAVELQVHNGTSLANVTSSFTPSASTAYDFQIYSDGSGNVTLYVNDSQVATSSAGPTGDSANTADQIQLEAAITSVASQTIAQLANLQILFAR